jgi:hypothetical protein
MSPETPSFTNRAAGRGTLRSALRAQRIRQLRERVAAGDLVVDPASVAGAVLDHPVGMVLVAPRQGCALARRQREH